MSVDNARLYEEAQQALHIQDQFLSLAAHELRTPITSIYGTTQLLLRGVENGSFTEPRLVNHLQVLFKQTQHLNRLISTLLDLSRLEAGQFTLELTPMDITELVQHIIEETSLAVETHKLVFHTEAKALLISGDSYAWSKYYKICFKMPLSTAPTVALFR